MGLATKIDTVFGHEKRDQLKNIDSALKLEDYRALYLTDFEAAFLKVMNTMRLLLSSVHSYLCNALLDNRWKKFSSCVSIVSERNIPNEYFLI